VVTGDGFASGQTVVKALCLGAYDAKQPDDPLRHLDALGHAPELPPLPPANALDCNLYGISQRASHTLLLRNALYDVTNPLVDRGQATTELETSIRKDDAYTPERGPIR